MNFTLSKQNALTKQDKSHEQKIDSRILPLCNKINSSPDLYTTSSCSGRITIVPDTNQKLKQGFLFKSHEKITLLQTKKILEKIRADSCRFVHKNFLWFRCEPAALHIACKYLEKAQQILSQARNLGWKKSGIISTKNRYVIELFAPETLITPITPDLPESHLKLLVTESNKKLSQTWNKIKLLEKIF